MANFDVSFLNPKLRKSSSSDYGFLVDQLDIKQSQLESDGKLSPGDYDLLAGMAEKIYSHPGLSPSQRSNIEVKIANYKQKKSTDSLKDANDISRINREIGDDMSKIGLRFANDPEKFLTAKAATLNAKIDSLSESINQLESAGDDTSNHINELNSTLSEYNDTLQALDDVKGSVGASAPKSDYAAYVTTNSKGEIVDLKIDRIGGQSGYNETNGLYGGLQVYGKVNRKDASGNKIFQLGNQTFTASDVVIPNADGSMKPSVLISSDKQKSSKGGITISQSGYTPVDLTQVRPQSSIREGGWVEGEKGFLYQRQGDGSYRKYVNSDKTKLGITDNDILRVPRSFEQSIIKNVTETVDGSATPEAPVPMTMFSQPAGPAPVAGMTTTTEPTKSQGKSTPNTGGAPTERAPQSSQGIAQKAIGAAKGFLGRLFGQ